MSLPPRAPQMPSSTRRGQAERVPKTQVAFSHVSIPPPPSLAFASYLPPAGKVGASNKSERERGSKSKKKITTLYLHIVIAEDFFDNNVVPYINVWESGHILCITARKS